MSTARQPAGLEQALHACATRGGCFVESGLPEGPSSTLSILVVEDDAATAELVRTILNDVSGWGATVVHDAAAAREVFKHVTIEILVLDVNLPGITGLELLELLRRDPAWREPPIILMSANIDQPDIRAALQHDGALRFLRKPFDVDELVAAVRRSVQEDQAEGAQATAFQRRSIDG
jgi:DNA-binding response OmpR family regulator